jgi:hypothetical protein
MKQKMFTKEQYEKLVANYKGQDGIKDIQSCGKALQSFRYSALGIYQN